MPLPTWAHATPLTPLFFPSLFSMVMVLHQHSHSHGGHGGHGHGNKESAGDTPSSRVKSHVRAENINVRAAFIHVIGDLVQSIGVVIAGYIISFWVGHVIGM